MANNTFSPLGMIVAYNRGLRGRELLLAGIIAAQFPNQAMGLLIADQVGRTWATPSAGGSNADKSPVTSKRTLRVKQPSASKGSSTSEKNQEDKKAGS